MFEIAHPFTVRLSDEELERLDRHRKQLDLSRSGYVRLALATFWDFEHEVRLRLTSLEEKLDRLLSSGAATSGAAPRTAVSREDGEALVKSIGDMLSDDW